MAYRRDIFINGFTNIKKIIHSESKGFHTDTYTGKSLKPGEPWDYDHIISAKEFSTLKNVDLINPDIQSIILNDRINIAITDRRINMSKGKYPLDVWLNKKSNGRNVTNAEFFNIDILKTELLRNRTLEELTKKIELALNSL